MADVSGNVLVSVLVPTLNEERYIAGTIGAIQAQRLDGEIEVLIIDGGSSDGTRSIVKRFAAEDPRVRLLDNPQRNIPAALNIGLSHARGRFVARMDAHSHYPIHYLETGIRRLRAGDVDWVSGPALARGADPGSRRVALALTTRLGVGGAVFRGVPSQEIEVDSGFTGVWRRETLLDHGGWDPRWLVNEDAELAARIRVAGGRIVCLPEMAAIYAPRNGLQALARQYLRYGQYRARTSRAHPESMRRSHLLPPAVVIGTLMAAMPCRRATTAGRMASALYLAALVTTAAHLTRRAEWRDAVAVPTVLATMHYSWGAGFLIGAVRFGPPSRAIVRALCRGIRTRQGADVGVR